MSTPASRRPFDPAAIALLALIGCGWFLLDNLVFTVGTVSEPTRFYAMLAVLRQPSLLLLGTSGHGGELTAFSLLCLAVLAAPLLTLRSDAPAARLAYAGPLLLMLVCFALLYANGSSDAAASAADHSWRGTVVQWADGAMQRAQTQVASRIHLASGALLSLLAAAALAWHGSRQFFSAARARQSCANAA